MDTNAQKKVQDLAAGWANFLSGQMGLNKDTFQLAQGTLGLQTADNSGLFLIADTIPADSAVAYYDGTNKKRSGAFGMLLSGLLPETNPQALTNALGNYYTDWITWKKDNAMDSGEDLLAYFKRWAAQSDIDPGAATRAEAAIISTSHSPLITAMQNFYNTDYQQSFTHPGEKPYSLHTYSATTNNAKTAVDTGQAIKNINFDSNSMSTETSSTFAEGSASGFYDIFSGKAGASFEQLNSKAASDRFTITGYLNKYATLNCQPGNWYSSAEVSRAYNGKDDNSIWDPGASIGDWDSFFKQPDGQLARYVSQLVLVSDYEITVTSHATYSKSEYQKIVTEASFGVWPFFSGHAKATHTSSFNHNEDGTLSVTHKLNKGLIQIWGVNIQKQS